MGLVIGVLLVAGVIYLAYQGTRQEKAKHSAPPPEEQWSPHQPFCTRCFAETLGLSAGDVYMGNGYGRALRGNLYPCADCHSVVQRLRFYAFFVVPILSYDWYRVIYAEKGLMSARFWSRKLKPEAVRARHL